MLVPMAVVGRVLTMGEGSFKMLIFMTEVFNNDGLTWANSPAISLNTFAKEKLDAMLIADINGRVHMDARSFPEIVQVLLAEPLRG